MEHCDFVEEMRFLDEIRDSLVAFQGGVLTDKFVAIKGRELVGIYDTRTACTVAARQHALDTLEHPVLVRAIFEKRRFIGTSVR